jgi:branched-chain amino acid aminotransferase
MRALELENLISADEVFITGTNKMIVPVVQVDAHQIGDGRPGQVTRTLMRAFGKQIDDYYKKQNN